ncbi:MAG: hypothetical protein J0M12_11745 [Deltaproteobacteria bacterium]|nr:hypothetical protein [Deltaproteobacteria bacterium]
MNTAASTTISARPSLAAWLLGGASLATVTFFMLVVLSYGKLLREESLYNSLRDRLKFKEYNRAEVLVEEIASPPFVFSVWSLLVSEQARQSRQTNLQTAKIVLSVLSAVGVNRIDEAEQRLATLPANSGEHLVRDLQNELLAVKESQAKLESKQRAIHAAEDSLNASAKQGTLVADEFGELLGLSAIHVSDEDAALPAYDHGVLQGLPRLKGLRDNIVDLNFLKVELEGLHAHPKNDGANTFESFTAKLQAIKTSYSEINSRFEAAVTELEQSQDATVALGREVSGRRNKLQSEISDRILELLQPSFL